jgi:D-mannonate dehydratase
MSLWPARGRADTRGMRTDSFGEFSGGGTEKDKVREEVEHFIEEYDELDEEDLQILLTVFILRTYPTRDAQDG